MPYRKRIVTVFIALVAMVSTYLPHLPILPAQQVFAQTPNTEVEAKPVEKSPVSGSFIDYYAEERQLKGHEGSVNSANFSRNGKFLVLIVNLLLQHQLIKLPEFGIFMESRLQN